MAAIAQRHAIEVSCPVVQREFFLLPDHQRRLFGGIDRTTSPVSEAFTAADITAESRSDRQTVSIAVSLAEGTKNVRLAFTNDFWHETEGDRNLFLDALVVRDGSGSLVDRVQLESLSAQERPDCNRPRTDDFGMYCSGWLDVPISISKAGKYRIELSRIKRPGATNPPGWRSRWNPMATRRKGRG